MLRTVKSNVLKNPRFHLLLFLGIITIPRIPYLLNPLAINPDEGELLATAKLASKSFFPYSNYTTPTFGPVWPEFLSLFYNLGLNLSFKHAHLISFILLIISYPIFQFCIHMRFNMDINFTLIFLFINLIIFLPASIEFGFLATETLPLAILTLSAIIMFRFRISPKTVYVAGLFSGLAVFSKYQVILIAFCIPLILIVRKIHFSILKCFMWYSFGMLSLATFLFIWVYLGGGFYNFFFDSLLFSFGYTSDGFGRFSGGASLEDKFQSGIKLLISQPMVVVILVLVLSLVIYWTKANQIRIQEKDGMKGIITVLIPIFIGFLSISIPGNGYSHYLLIFIWCLQFSLILLLVLIKSKKVNSMNKELKIEIPRFNRFKSKLVYLSILIMLTSLIVFIKPSPSRITNQFYRIQENNMRFDSLRTSLLREFQFACPRESKVIVWGWSSEYYTYFDWIPIDNLINDAIKLKLGFNEKEVQRNVIKALKQGDVQCIVNAVGNNYFGNFTELDRMELMINEAMEILESSYRTYDLDSGGNMWVLN